MNRQWTEFLQAQGASFDAQEPEIISFAPLREETARAARDTVLMPLTHLGLIEVSGDEASDFLHKLGSNDIKKLAPERAQLNSLNSPKGRMLASFIVWCGPSTFSLALSADLQTAIQKKLSMYVLRAKVTLSDARDNRVLLGLAGPKAAGLLRDTGIGVPAQPLEVTQGETRAIHLDGERYILDCPAEQASGLWQKLAAAGASPAGSAAWRWLDIQAGLPVITAQAQDEFVAQMLNFELLGGVNFQKGCYPGQEIVARTQYLGKLKKRMYRAHVTDTSAAVAGADLYAAEFGAQSCGKLLSVVASPEGGFDLLAVMQISAFEAGEVHLGSVDGPRLTLGTLPYTID